MARPTESLDRFIKLWERLERVFGAELAEKIIWELVGEVGEVRLTIPGAKTLNRELRDQRLRKEYDRGQTARILAEGSGLSPRRINDILQNVPLFPDTEY